MKIEALFNLFVQFAKPLRRLWLFVVVPVFLSLCAGGALADTMTRSPANCISTGTGTAWTTPNGATASDDVYAAATLYNSTTEYLQCTNYGFSIPSGSVINGITVNIERSGTTGFLRGNDQDAAVRIVRGGTIGNTDRSTTTVYTATDQAESHGSATDLWGLTWSIADINAANFGAAFRANNAGAFFFTSEVRVDQIEITVTYTPPDTTPPSISGITTYCGGINQLLVSFSESLNAASAQNVDNYALSGGVTVTSATLQPDGKSVLLRTNTLPAGGYNLTVNGVRDLAGNQMGATSQTASVNGVVTPGVRGAYYTGMSDQFPGTPVVRIDSTINFDWGNGTTGVSGIPADQFSVRWTGFVLAPATGSYVLRTRSDDGVRLYFDGQTLIDNWTDHAATNNDSAALTLTAGQYYALQMDFYENGGQAAAQLYGNYNNTRFQVVPAGNLFYCQIPTTVTPGRFNAFDTGTASGATSGPITTKIAATAFNLDLVALTSTPSPIVQTNFTGDVKVELLGNLAAGGTLDGNGCPNSSTLLGSATANFAAGDLGRKANVQFNTTTYAGTANAWRDVRVRISYPATGTATVVSCSSDNFAIRPASLSNVIVTDQDWSTAGTSRTLNNVNLSGGVVHKAGRPFSISAEARNSAGAVTTNYNGTPSPSAVTCNGSGSGCTVAVGTVLAPSWTAASGVASTGTATYSEVGSFNLQLQDADFASVDTSDGSTAAQRNIPSATVLVGRFVPDNFLVATGNTPVFKTFNDTSCGSRSFTYIGQPFGYLTAPVATVTARNAAGITTQNYQGAWWKLTGAGVQQTYTSASGTISGVTLNAPAVVASTTSPGTGTITISSGDLIRFDRNATAPQASFNANIVLTLSASDTSESSGAITSTSPAVFDGDGTGIAFDAGNAFRYGILKLANAHGSELLKLPVPLEAQYWNGSGFVTNTADHCTSIAASDIAVNNFQKNLVACETTVSLSGRFSGGKGKLELSKPGSGNSGSVDLRINLGTASGSTCLPPNTSSTATTASQDYLRTRLNSGGYVSDPTARATFGVRSSGPVIYLREMY